MEPIYDSVAAVIRAVQDGELDAAEVTLFIDTDFVQAYRTEEATFDDEYPEAIPPAGDVQLLAEDNQLPRATLKRVVEELGMDAGFA